MFLARYTNSGIDAILDMEVSEYFEYLNVAIKQYKQEKSIPTLVVLADPKKLKK